MDITSFSQLDGESLYETWERFRELLRRCPHHGLPDWLIVQTFYNGLSFSTKTTIDAAAGGALMGKSPQEAQSLIEEMAANNYQWANERGNPRRHADMIEMDTLNMLGAQMNNVVKLLNRQAGVGSSSSNAHVACCSVCGGEHDTNDCVDFEQVQFVNNYNRNAQNNPYSNTYNPGWRNHPNFVWKDQSNQHRPTNPPGFQPRQPQAETKLGWEIAVEKLAKVTSDRFERVEGRLDQLTTMYRNVEVQIGQIAGSLNNRNQGELPSKTELEDPPVVESEKNEREKQEEKERNQEASLEEDSREKPREDQPSSSTTIPIPPAVPFPQRLKPNKIDKEFEKFVKIFKQLHINIPFADAILQIPSYAKFLKEIMTRKRKLEDCETIALTEECSAIIQNKLPLKLKDPRSFSIPCTIGNIDFSKALYDLGSSVSLIPLTVARQLDMEEDISMPIILGRPFLATAGMQEGDCEAIEEVAKYLDFQAPYNRGNAYESLGQGKGLPPPSEIEPPKLELKPLPTHLRYEFLGENNTLPVIVSAYLDEKQCAK
ncbi:uncharacterized protein LOC113765424 [Coffea eugenioides]|uniref:uncharacterized protein LOC113765424 n=1 Tax=Coffea eugenioides TaxID=49369 RepID=UPI000F60DF65|nr:uncharacterized protein LOC113765424 [Coffea eugenioides]